MPKRVGNSIKSSNFPPSTSPEGQEQRMIALAINLAEQQLRDGTASSQVISHYLKLATIEERNKQLLDEQKLEYMKAKTEAMKSAKHVEEMYEEAIKAMREYAGVKDEDL